MIITIDSTSVLIEDGNRIKCSSKPEVSYDYNTIVQTMTFFENTRLLASGLINTIIVNEVRLSETNYKEVLKDLFVVSGGGGADPVYEFKLETTSYEITDADIINNIVVISGAISTKDGATFNSLDVDNLPNFFNGKVDILTENRLMFNLNPTIDLKAGSYDILLKQRESDLEQTITIKYTDYVEINGIKWARTNLVADSSDSTGMTSKFARHSSDYGSLYQWGRKQAWNPGLPNVVTGMPTANVTGTVWPDAENPCPSGWRLPTADDFESLYGDSYIKVHELAGSVGNITPGFFVGAAGYNEATISDPKGCLFLPISGYRTSAGQMAGLGQLMYYWSSTPGGSGNTQSYYLNQNWNTTDPTLANRDRNSAHSLRLVKI